MKIHLRSHPDKPNQRKASSWIFPRGKLEQKFDVNHACFPKENTPGLTKMGDIHELSFWPFLWFGLPGRLLIDTASSLRLSLCSHICIASRIVQRTRVYPYPLGEGSARPNPKMGAPDPENPLFLGFSVLRLSGPILRDTARLSQRYPPIARYGVFGVSTWPIGCDTPSPFSERFPLGEHAKWRRDTPPQKGYLSDTCAIPYENKANGCDTPLCDTISKGYCAIWGGISHWASKCSDGDWDHGLRPWSRKGPDQGTPSPTPPQDSPEAAQNGPNWTETDRNGPKWIEWTCCKLSGVSGGQALPWAPETH